MFSVYALSGHVSAFIRNINVRDRTIKTPDIMSRTTFKLHLFGTMQTSLMYMVLNDDNIYIYFIVIISHNTHLETRYSNAH